MDWLSDKLCEALRWQIANPGADPRDGPEIPPAGVHVWSIFLALHNSRAVGFVPCAIAHAEIEAWSRLHRQPVRPFDSEIIRDLDRAFLEYVGQTKPGNDKAPAVSGRPMSVALFDAIF
jgi:hypothetical protein